MTLLISYKRWSSEEQTKGDSLRRQQDLIDKFIETHPDYVVLPEHQYTDKGVSSFKQIDVTKVDVKDEQQTGEKITQSINRATGDLARFFDNMKEGKFPRGSVLLVEQLDRLSRAKPRQAYRDFSDIIDKGITVIALGDNGKTYTAESLDANPFEIMQYFFKAWNSYEESLKKSQRLQLAWKEKKRKALENGTAMTSVAPGWLILDKATRQFSVDEKKANIVRGIFQKRLEGLSFYRIAIVLNEENTPIINGRMIRADIKERIKEAQARNGDYSGLDEETAKKARRRDRTALSYLESNWSKETVKYLLRSKTVLGVLPETKDRPEIENYYPAIIDRFTFEQVQEKDKKTSEGKQRAKGRCTATDNPIYLNIFRGLISCGECGLTMQPSGQRNRYFGVYRCNSFAESRKVGVEFANKTPDPFDKNKPFDPKARRKNKAGNCCQTVSRKAFDANLCSRLFANLHVFTQNKEDVQKLSELQTRRAELDKQVDNLTETIINLSARSVPAAITAKLADVSDELEKVKRQIKTELLRKETVDGSTLGKLDYNNLADRSKAQDVIKQLVRKVTLYGSTRTCDIELYNGSAIIGLQYEQEGDLTARLRSALTIGESVEDATWKEIKLALGLAYTKTVVSGAVVEPIDYDAEGWPETEPDYPNTAE